MRPYIILLFWLIATCNQVSCQPRQQPEYKYLSKETDSLIFEQLAKAKLADLPLSPTERFVAIARHFIDAPYEAGTLEINNSEKLVVNLRSFDCTTLIETCLALTHSAKMEKLTFEYFKSNLLNIRYRNGQIDDYASRLHYMTEWITDNERKGFVQNITCGLGADTIRKAINFMSNHPNSYKQLSGNKELIAAISNVEKIISLQSICYIPKEQFGLAAHRFKEGMIAIITTDIKGLDFVHAGILIEQKGELYLLHASSDKKKVVITDEPFYEYLSNNPRQTGAVILSLPDIY
jgi:hypothetical protein